MLRPVKVTFLSLVLGLSFGCGARTALLIDEERDAGSDAAPDVFGPYPCNYSYTGELTSVVPHFDVSARPRLAWAADRLVVGFWAGSMDWPFLGMCTTTREEGFLCSDYEEVGVAAWWMGDIAWNGSGFGVCWGGEHPDHLAWEGILFRSTTATGEPLTESIFVDEDFMGNCHDLVWVEDHYLSYWAEEGDFSPTMTRIVRLNREGEIVGSAIPDLDPLIALPFAVDLEADGPTAALAWGSEDGIWIRPLEGMDGGDVLIPVNVAAIDYLDFVALGLRGPIAAIVWNEQDGRDFNIQMVLVDLNRGVVGEPVVLASEQNYLVGLEVIGVYEGFMVAWMDYSDSTGTSRFLVNPTRVHAGLRIEPRWIQELHEGFMEFGLGLVGPSIGYDGTDVYVGISMLDEDFLLPQVHIQRLACHR